MTKSDIPKQYPETYSTEFKSKFLVYNPTSRKGLVLLRNDAFYVYSLANGKRSIESIFNLLRSSGIRISLDALIQYFRHLEEKELVYVKSPATYGKIINFKADTLYVWLHITNQCNLRCTYCFVKKSPEQMDEKTLHKTMRAVFATAQRNNLKHVVIVFSGGEPMLQLKKIIKGSQLANQLGKRTGIQTSLEILTNGTLMTRKAAKLLRQENILASISIDGIGPVHDQTRPFVNKNGSFTHVSAGIRNAQEEGILKHINITLTSRNIHHLPEFVSYCLDNKIRFSLQYFEETEYAESGLELKDDVLLVNMRKILKIIHKKLPPYKILNGISHNVSFDNPRLGCGASMRTFFVARHDGEISSCNWELEKEKTLGSIGKGDIMTTLKEKGYITPILNLKKKTTCATCRWRFICTSCPLYFVRHKKATSPPYCEVNKKIIPELLKMEAARLLKYGS